MRKNPSLSRYNREKEANETKGYHRDFFDIRKVDTHIHHSACMHVKLLLNFMIKKYHEEPNIQAIKEKSTGKILTLKEVFDKYNLSVYKLNVDHLDVRADHETFQRFDRFNKKYNPFSQTELREIFLKHENFMGGRYLGEISKEVFQIYSDNKYEFVEPRLSIYGNSIFGSETRWLIQIPRLYSAYKEAGSINNFQDMLDNIFKPIFDATINPSLDPSLYKFLLSVVGFDTVDDESISEKAPSQSVLEIPPEKYNRAENPHYCYWTYYIWVNVFTLNAFRKARGLNTFSFRPHSGEAGSADHLASAYLLADSINHGIMLGKATVLQYLFYLKQIGLAMSPLSNNKLFMKYKKNPFPEFFKRGMNISLSTDDPLIFHLTYQPLLEEYSIASQVYDLSTVDVCEIARNSVLQSGFEDLLKSYWIGGRYQEDSNEANDPTKTNVSPIRFRFRRETLKTELRELNFYAIDRGVEQCKT